MWEMVTKLSTLSKIGKTGLVPKLVPQQVGYESIKNYFSCNDVIFLSVTSLWRHKIIPTNHVTNNARSKLCCGMNIRISLNILSRDTVTWYILRYKIKKYKSRGFISAGDSLKALSRILSSKVDYITQNNLQYIQPNRYKTTIISHILWLISYESW